MKQFIYIIGFLLAFSSCSKNEYVDPEINGTYAEFVSTSQSTIIPFIADGEYDIAVPIQIFGQDLSNDKVVNVVVSGNTASNIFTTESVKTLTPNVCLDSIHILVNTKNLVKGKNYNIQLSLMSSDVTISKNYATCELTFSQQVFIDYFSGAYNCAESSTNTKYDVTFTRVNDSTVRNENFWDFPLAGQYVPFVFSQSEAKTVTINETEWIDLLGNTYTVSGSGVYDLNGNFSVNFIMKEGNSETIYQSGTQIYTKYQE